MMGKYGKRASRFGFEDLEVYKAARRFRMRVYQLARRLPDSEKYSLAQQMYRAAVSLTNNIAEGYGRHHWQQNTQFCRQSRGSLLEIVDDINVCGDQQYAEDAVVHSLRNDAADVLRILNGYIAYLQRQKQKEQQSK